MIPTWGAAFGANAIFNSAEYRVDLTHSAIPDKAASGTTATFTRATTATVRDHEGVLRTAIAGEARFEGARRVRNLVVGSSEDLSNTAYYTAFQTTVTSDQAIGVDGALSMDKIAEAATTNVHIIRTNNIPTTVNTTYTCSIDLKQGTQRYATLLFWGVTSSTTREVFTVDLSNGTISTAGVVPANVSVTPVGDAGSGIYRCRITGTTSATDVNMNLYVYLSNNGANSPSYAGDTGKYIYAGRVQIEDVTAQTTQTAGEYVSVGVESAPYYHGSFVDGVKCFPTDLAGNPLTTMLGYSAEGARTNLCLQSQTFDNASWTKDNATISADAIAAPDGTTTADKIVEAATTAQHRAYQSVALTAATHTFSVYLKSGGRDWACIALTTGANNYAWFNLSTGSVGTVNVVYGSTATISSFGNGWYRCSITITTTAASWVPIVAAAESDNVFSYAGDVTKGIYAWGAQVELGSFASSYIATTTIAVARNADVLTYSSAGNIDGTKGWCYAEVAIPTLSGQTQLIAGASVNSAAMYISSDTKVSIYDNTAERKGAAFTASSSVGKLVTTWGGSESKTAFNGTASAALGFDGDLNYSGNLQIGAYAGASAALPMFGTIRNVRIGQRQLSASELQAVTA